MKNKRRVYNINTFSFYRRQVKPIDLDKAFINLIEKEEKKRNEKKISIESDKVNSQKDFNSFDNANILNNNIENNTKISKKINLDLIFPKISIERIKKIRDLFLEFDSDKSRTFDQNEIYLMFQMNKIPLTPEEIKDLFGFNNLKKDIKFNEFIQLTVNEYFSNKFKKLIMEKVRYRTNEGDICPYDFSDMLSHLCEFGKLSPELKKRKKTGGMKHLSENKKPSILNLDSSKKLHSSPRNSIMTEIVKHLNDTKVKDKKIDFNNEKHINEIRKETNLSGKEAEFNNFVEITNKKIFRFNEYLKKANIRDKILKRKEKLSKSLKIINGINSDIAKNYICYYPTENVFKNGKTNSILSFSFKKNDNNLSDIKFNTAEKYLSGDKKKKLKNIYFFKNLFKNNKLMKLIKKEKYLTNIKTQKSKPKSKQEKLKEKEFASIFANFRLNENNLPAINKKGLYSEKTFINTGLHSDLTLNM